MINHIGFAVPSIAEFLQRNQVLYGRFSAGALIANATQRVNEMFITDGNTVLELLEPAGPTSPILGVLKRNPAGSLLHVALDVDDLESALSSVEKAGGRVIVDPVPDIAFDNRRIAFVLLNGHVTEFIERRRIGQGR